VELRDGDKTRYNGQGVLTAVGRVNGEIAQALTGRTFASATEIDRALIELDGTDTKSRLGANAVVGVSLAAFRAEAALAGRELWRHLAAGSARLLITRICSGRSSNDRSSVPRR
jgi:enolase